MQASPLPPDSRALDLALCPNCRSEILLHQPDSQLPDRLLGTCQGCKSWYLLDALGRLLFSLPAGSETSGAH